MQGGWATIGLLPDPLPERNMFLRPLRKSLVAMIRHNIRDESFVIGAIAADDDGRLMHTRMLV
jgi:hypothetical protein